jgi:hypothetical protein
VKKVKKWKSEKVKITCNFIKILYAPTVQIDQSLYSIYDIVLFVYTTIRIPRQQIPKIFLPYSNWNPLYASFCVAITCEIPKCTVGPRKRNSNGNAKVCNPRERYVKELKVVEAMMLPFATALAQITTNSTIVRRSKRGSWRPNEVDNALDMIQQHNVTNPTMVHAVLLAAVVRKDGLVSRRLSRNIGAGDARSSRVIERRHAVDEKTFVISRQRDRLSVLTGVIAGSGILFSQSMWGEVMIHTTSRRQPVGYLNL